MGNAAPPAEGEGIMGISLLRATGRLFVPVVAVGLLAGVSLEAGAYGEKGRIALQVGADVATTFFVFESRDASGDWQTSSDQQMFTAADRGCTIWETTTSLVNLIPNGDTVTGPDASSFLGFGPTSIGVYDGPTGVPCSRVSILKKATETLGASLGSKVTNTTYGYGANAFDRLELDIEAKGNVKLKLTVKLAVPGLPDRKRDYYLLTGSNVTGEISPDGFEADGSNPIFNCSAASDSGNDSGASDNCRWIINDWGQSFTITPLAGEFSLEGAGDYGLAGDKRSFIYLANIESGPLNCGDSVSASISDAEYCMVSLLERDENAECKAVPYALLYNEDRCEFYSTTDQLIANVEVVYEAEPAPTPVTGPPPMPSQWLPARLSTIVFGDISNPNKLPTSFPIPPCLGLTLIPDGRPDVVGPAPIPEVEPLELDLIDGNDTIEFACAFSRSESYETNTSTNVLEVVIKEGVQFWSDPVLVRGGDR